MTSFVTRLNTAARRRVAYQRTLAELNALPLATMIDLDIAPNEFPKIAHKAVYGA